MTPIKRRSLLQLGAASAAVTAGTVSISAKAAGAVATTNAARTVDAHRVRRYVTLGRTNMKISDISFGSSRLRTGQEHLVKHALDRGVNYFDTAESYTNSVSETVLGNALRGHRDKVYIATKMHVGAQTSRTEMTASLDESLRRLQTDYVDVFFNHAVNDIARLQNPEWQAFVEASKKAGKLRFTGMSGHAGNLVESLEYGLDNNMFDVILVATNFGQDPAFYERFTRSFDFVANQPELPRAMAKARKNNVGVIAMKVLRGAKLNDMRPFETGQTTYSQAAFRWILQDPSVDAAIISMTSTEVIDEYLGGSGGMASTDDDFQLLEQYARLTDLTYCRHACNDCEGACPYGVPIADVLRTRMYATDYGDLPFAKSEYRNIATNADEQHRAKLSDGAASACLGCDGKPCQDACTHGLSIAQLCGPTHLMLS